MRFLDPGRGVGRVGDDTTATYFVAEDEPAARDNGNPVNGDSTDGSRDGMREPAGFRTWGKPNDHRDGLPQVVIGRDQGRNPRSESVAGRGFTSAENRRYLRQGGGYMIGEKLRSGSTEAQAALSRQGRYKHVAGNLEGQGGADRRGRTVHHRLQPRAAERDAAIRARMIIQPEDAIVGSDQPGKDKRAELPRVISTKPGPNRYLREG